MHTSYLGSKINKKVREKSMELSKKWNLSITRRRRKFNKCENHNWILLCLLLYLSVGSCVIASINPDLYSEKLISANNNISESRKTSTNNLIIPSLNSTNHLGKSLITDSINKNQSNILENLSIPNQLNENLENSTQTSDRNVGNPIENGWTSFPTENHANERKNPSGNGNPFKGFSFSGLSNFSYSNLNDSENKFNKSSSENSPTDNKRIIFNINSGVLPTIEQFSELKSRNNNRENLYEILKIKPNKRTTFQSFLNQELKSVIKFQSENSTRFIQVNESRIHENHPSNNGTKQSMKKENEKKITVHTSKNNYTHSRNDNIHGSFNKKSNRLRNSLKNATNNSITVTNTNQTSNITKTSENDNQNKENNKLTLKNVLTTNSYHKNRKNQTKYSSKNRINSVFEHSHYIIHNNNKNLSRIEFRNRKKSAGKISLLGLFELTTRWGLRPEGQSELAAAQMAVKHINRQGILPGYTLELITNDTQVIFLIFIAFFAKI